jgi:hypothetical protein
MTKDEAVEKLLKALEQDFETGEPGGEDIYGRLAAAHLGLVGLAGNFPGLYARYARLVAGLVERQPDVFFQAEKKALLKGADEREPKGEGVEGNASEEGGAQPQAKETGVGAHTVEQGALSLKAAGEGDSEEEGAEAEESENEAEAGEAKAEAEEPEESPETSEAGVKGSGESSIENEAADASLEVGVSPEIEVESGSPINADAYGEADSEAGEE